jgi:hypothetical protein
MFFGTGLVKTVEDFGAQGELPSHPELLDWLAQEYVRERWSLKQLLRTIVRSATYRQAALCDARRLEIDPDDALLSRSPRGRLPAELLRDNALAIAGLLDPHLGGPSVFPPQPDGIWAPVYSDDRWMESQAGERVRRGLYTFWRRSSPYASFMLFDAPSREGCCARRARSDTPLQALALLNDVTYVEAARVLAERMIEEGGPTPEARIAWAFKRATARTPDADEVAVLARGLALRIEKYKASLESAKRLNSEGETKPNPRIDPAELAAYTMTANVILNLDEVVTRE